jgi:Tol biopolymer transport system component
MRWGVLLAIMGCGRVHFDALPDAAPCRTFGAWTSPTYLSSAIQSSFDDWSPAPTEGLLAIYWHSFRQPTPGGTGPDIWFATRSDLASDFGTPMPVTEVDTPDEEDDPTLTGDGLTLLFVRNTATTSMIYETQRASTTDAFDPPTAHTELGALFETGTFLSEDGLRLVFGSIRGDIGGIDLYETQRTARMAVFDAPVLLATPSSTSNDRATTLSHDGLELFFASDRAGGPGGFDVYTATRTAIGQPFGPATLVMSLSSPMDDVGLRLTPDGQTMYFNYDTIVAGGGNADFYIATRTCLD